MSKVAKKQQKGPEALEKFLQGHPVPVVLGPGQKRYLIDHHHLCSALHKMGVESCYAGINQTVYWVWPLVFSTTAGGRISSICKKPCFLAAMGCSNFVRLVIPPPALHRSKPHTAV
jgi:hypothetical protein